MVELLAAFQFLTIFPPVIKRAFTARELGRSAGFYPLVGLALGGVLYGAYWLFNLALPVAVSAALVLAIWVGFTRALHLDGFMDSCDGLFGGFTPERRLEIMRDSRVGAFGVAGGVLLLLVKYSLMVSLPNPLVGLLLTPALGRWALTTAIGAFPYARPQGMGRDIKDNTRWPQLFVATLIAGAAAWLLASWWGLVVLASAAVLIFLWVRLVLKRIPGLTGDIYGATCELVEVLVMILLVQTIF